MRSAHEAGGRGWSVPWTRGWSVGQDTGPAGGGAYAEPAYVGTAYSWACRRAGAVPSRPIPAPSAVRAGASSGPGLGNGRPEIMDQTGQKDVKTVMRYVRNARSVRASAAAKLGL